MDSSISVRKKCNNKVVIEVRHEDGDWETYYSGTEMYRALEFLKIAIEHFNYPVQWENFPKKELYART
jgi:hypothetical protein